jgi:hypothetical protein
MTLGFKKSFFLKKSVLQNMAIVTGKWKIQIKIRENQTKNRQNLNNKKKTAFLFGFPLIIEWISLFLSLDFPDSFENPGNPNKKICFLYLIFVWISPFLFGFHRF